MLRVSDDKAGLRGSGRQIEIDGQPVRVGGDVILAIAGQPVKSFDDVVTYLARFGEVNQAVTLTLLRQGNEVEVTASLSARPKSSEVRQEQPGRTDAERGGAWLGIIGQTVTPEIAQAMDLPAEQQGVLVLQVEANGPADKAGLRGSDKPTVIKGERTMVGGDIITAFNGQNVAQLEELQGLVKDAKPGDGVKLSLLRDGRQIDLTVTPGARPVR